MTPEILAILRAPFPPGCIGKLPKVSCKDCAKRSCTKPDHKPSRCKVCHAWITPSHVDLDFVGHADTTDRLLTADPGWTWEPLGWTEDGMPLVKKGLGGEWTMWIRLTVAGVTRLGVGSVAAGAYDAEKQLIGDAIRNAAMRFGVALDLWAKGDLESSLADATDEPGVPKAAKATKAAAKAAPAPPPAHVDPDTGEVKATRRRPPPAIPPGAMAPPTPAKATADTGPLPPEDDAFPMPEPRTPEVMASDEQHREVVTAMRLVPPERRAAFMKQWSTAGIPSNGDVIHFTAAHANQVQELVADFLAVDVNA